MTQDPFLFTAMEWVLFALAGLMSLVLFALWSRADPRLPFAERDENWRRDTDQHSRHEKF